MLMKNSRLLIIESNELTRIGMCAVLSEEPELDIVGDTGDVDEALTLFESVKPELVLMDLMMPDCRGMELCRRMRENNESVKLFLISDCCDHQCLVDAFMLGVEGYVVKDIGKDELVSSIKQVLEGKTVMAPEVAEHVVEHLRDGGASGQPQHRIDTLSTQERRVLELVARGKSNRQVAEELQLSEKTVKNYFSSVLSKLSANRRTEAAVMYWEYQKTLTVAT